MKTINREPLLKTVAEHEPGDAITVSRDKYLELLACVPDNHWVPYFNYRPPGNHRNSPFFRIQPDEVLPEDVYGEPTSKIDPPPGYRFTGEFRVGLPGEAVLGGCVCIENDNTGYHPMLPKNGPTGFPVLILEDVTK